jgi:hypothetical protein
MATDSSVHARVERLYSPLWLTTVFSPEVDAEFEALGLHPLQRYFASRVAPIGAVSAPVVVATFLNFSPAAVERTIPEIWTRLRPQQLSGDEQLTLTPAGRAYRERIEARTNDCNAPAYRSATDDDLAKLTTLGANIGNALRADGPSWLGDLVPDDQVSQRADPAISSARRTRRRMCVISQRSRRR